MRVLAMGSLLPSLALSVESQDQLKALWPPPHLVCDLLNVCCPVEARGGCGPDPHHSCGSGPGHMQQRFLGRPEGSSGPGSLHQPLQVREAWKAGVSEAPCAEPRAWGWGAVDTCPEAEF